MRIPESLAKQGKERIKDYPVEGFVYGEGPDNPVIMLVGEAPGETEIHNGIPFSGRAGKELMQSLEFLGLTRDDVYITSAVRSRPYKWGQKKDRKSGEMIDRKYNRAPTAKEIVAHAPILDYEVKNVHAPLIVTLGNIGLQRLAGKDKKVTQIHGQLLKQPVQYLETMDDTKFKWTEEDYEIFPTFHPAAIFYNRSLEEKLKEDLEKLKKLIEERGLKQKN
ncbi:uracil-DNA glycosylase [Jeotgalibacillus malaysiensis]|uniref:Uracil-DNA glycosylase n=1 Tax=Jeotgalibacillus malaysiensis TaxID=1508404 RepID=A0A0B5AMY0_9BACL|nr:uracil-DNA glycosylase [Jeotgalibacillus malaysiensis]AJD90022.1 uracil-DNA glycosylase [Jeotgalibacillus malaysiensis]